MDLDGRSISEWFLSPMQRKGWCAGSTEPGNVFVMFFQTPIYE